MIEIKIDSKAAGGRLDKFLFKYLDKVGSGFVYKMLRKKNITLNGRKSTGNDILQDGDVIKLFLSDETVMKFSTAKSKGKEASNQELKKYIVYEDENIIVMNKPSGMLSQKVKTGDRSLNDLLLEYLGSDPMFTPGISNRLDRNTSGIVLAGKNPAATRELNRAVKERSISKFYLCPVRGSVEHSMEIRGYLLKNEADNKVAVYDEQVPGSSYIVTGYRPVRQNSRYTLLEVDLQTGRSHQIRAHLASIGHPVLGDPKYGDRAVNSILKESYGIQDQLLHARRITFDHMEGILEYLNGTEVKADIPAKMKKFLKGEELWQPGAAED